jgi:hypothetical protein
MRMRQQDGAERFWIEAQFSVFSYRLVSPALKHSAIQQHSKAGHFHQVSASGDGTGSAME